MVDFWVPRSSFHYRSELPGQASWSNDASLLAVAAGAFVLIYDSATNVLLQVMTASECSRVSSVHFLGSSGRFLAVAGEKDLVLWDLVSQTSTPSGPSVFLFYSRSYSSMALSLRKSHWSSCHSPLGGQIGITSASQEQQLERSGDPRTSFST